MASIPTGAASSASSTSASSAASSASSSNAQTGATQSTATPKDTYNQGPAQSKPTTSSGQNKGSSAASSSNGGEQPKQQSKDERANAANTNTLDNAADVAIASKNPYAMAAGAAYKGLNKLTGGKFGQAAGKVMTKANKMAGPAGKQVQNATNKFSESGAADKVGGAARTYNGIKGGGAGAAGNAGKAAGATKGAESAGKANNASKASDAGKTASKGGNAQPKSNANQGSNSSSQPKNDDSKKDEGTKGKLKKLRTFAIIMSILKVILSILLLLLPILLIFLLVTLIVTTITSLLFGDNNGEECYYANNCQYVEIYDTNGSLIDRYGIQDYLAGAVNYYYGDFDTNAKIKSAGLLINSDLLYTGSTDEDTKVCKLSTSSKYSNVKIVEETDDMTEEQQQELEKYQNIKSQIGSDVYKKIVIGYKDDDTEYDINTIKNSSKTDAESILKEYYKIDDDDETFKVMKICIQQSNRVCSTSVSGVSDTGDINVSNLTVELINCDASKNDYKVLGEVDFKKYVLGVALAEIGPSSPEEAIKTQIIAARNFALTRNQGMCPGNKDSCWLGYSTDDNKITMRACENDQVYWDYTKDIYRYDRGDVSLYSPEIDSSYPGAKIWANYYSMSQADQEKYEALAEEVEDVVLLDDEGNVAKIGYVASISQKFIDYAKEGDSYQQILEKVYGYTRFNNVSCYGGSIDYGDYSLNTDGLNVLRKPLSQFLLENGSSIEELNDLIKSNVDKQGRGTRAGVVAAAVTLIGEMSDNYGVRLPYYWGGGHGGSASVGASGSWGTQITGTVANEGIHYNTDGIDCSGFVRWAFANGGLPDYSFSTKTMLSRSAYSKAKSVNLTNSAVLQPGDALLNAGSHVILVIGIDEANNKYICAEAGGQNSGIYISEKPYNLSGYVGVDMSAYYNE